MPLHTTVGAVIGLLAVTLTNTASPACATAELTVSLLDAQKYTLGRMSDAEGLTDADTVCDGVAELVADGLTDGEALTDAVGVDEAAGDDEAAGVTDALADGEALTDAVAVIDGDTLTIVSVQL